MSNTLFSVIIPAYNAEAFLSRSVDSVLQQSYQNFELILVDDGSTDSSGSLCDRYAADHNNIRVVHKENGGLSSARNAGMAVMQGEYVLFLDADDYFDHTALETLAAVVQDHAPHIIDFGLNYVTPGVSSEPNMHKLPKNTLLGADVLRDLILPPLLNLRDDPDHFVFNYSTCRAYRQDILNTHQIRFDENRRVWEDRSFVLQYLYFCRNYYSIDACLYNYVYVPGSLSQTYFPEFFDIILENFKFYRDLYGSIYDFDTQYVTDYWCRSIENIINLTLQQNPLLPQHRQHMLDILRNPQVVAWFSHRSESHIPEYQAGMLIATGNPEAAVERYAHIARKKSSPKKIPSILRRVLSRLNAAVKR